MKKTKKIMLFIFLLILVASIAHAALLSKYVTITGRVTILPSDEPNTPPNKEACMNGGYLNYVKLSGNAFKNQGDCVSYMQTYMCEDWEILNTMYPDLNVGGPSAFGRCVAYFSRLKNEKDKDETQEQSYDLNIIDENTTTNETEQNITIDLNDELNNLTIIYENETYENTTYENITNYNDFTNNQTTNTTQNLSIEINETIIEQDNWTNTTNIGDVDE